MSKPAQAWTHLVLRGGDHLYQCALWIVSTVAMPSWITGEAAG